MKQDALVSQPLPHHPRTGARRIQNVNALMFQHSRAHTIFHVVPAFAFQHHAIDAPLVQKLSQQQAGRPRANDRNLSAHEG
jgi:hypothetical protein